MKLLLWLAIIAAVVMWLRPRRTGLRSGAAQGDPANDKAAARTAEKMLRCAHCGVHFPASEAIGNTAGGVFCSEQHRLLHGAH